MTAGNQAKKRAWFPLMTKPNHQIKGISIMPQILALSFINERNSCPKYFYMAEAYKPDPNTEQADWEWQQIEFELDQSATRVAAQDEVTKRLGDGWTLQNFWVPAEESEF